MRSVGLILDLDIEPHAAFDKFADVKTNQYSLFSDHRAYVLMCGIAFDL